MLDKKTANANIGWASKLALFAVGLLFVGHHRDRADRRPMSEHDDNPFHLPSPSAQPMIASLGVDADAGGPGAGLDGCGGWRSSPWARSSSPSASGCGCDAVEEYRNLPDE